MPSLVRFGFFVVVWIGSIPQRGEGSELCIFNGEAGRCEVEGECTERILGTELYQRRFACSHVRDRTTVCCPAKRSPSSNGRIVGGENAKPLEYPWMAALLHVSSSRKPFCGGSLITPFHVLTAAHCVYHIGQDLISYRVRMGEHNFDTESEAQHQDFYIRRIHINPNYRKTDYAVYDDLAILELSGSWREDPKTACLPDRPVDTRNREAIVIGWGVTSMGSDFQPSVLQQVEVDIYPHEKCESLYRGIEFTHICAGDHDFGGKDSCLGDSGGPLHVCLGRRWVQVGIVSYGFHCGKPQQPGVYVNISSFLPWIVGNIHPYRLNDAECGKTSEDPGGTIRCFSVDEETEENDFDSVDTECDSTRLRYSNILGFFSSLIYLARLRAVGY